MALGDNYGKGSNNKGNNSPVVYSAYKMSNITSDIDKTSFTASFWNSMLKLSIAPMKEGSTEDNISFDYDLTDPVYLTHTKARMLFLDALDFEAAEGQIKSQGVATGKGLIYLSNGAEFGKAGVYLVIKKINPQTGEVESSYTYEFKQDYHFSIKNFNPETSDYDKVYRNNLEFEQFKCLLKSYYEAMTGAVAYSVIDQMKYNTSRLNTKVDLVMDKLGIEKAYGKGSSKSGGSFFNGGNKGGSSNSGGSSFNNGGSNFNSSASADEMFGGI